MVTDYAQHHKSPRRSHKRILLTIIILLIAILLPLTMFYVRYHKTIHSKGQKTPVKTTSSLPAKKPDHTKPQFDFYTLLPKMRVPVPKANTHSFITQRKDVTYALQVFSVRGHDEAKHLRKKLTRMGYRAYVKAYKSTSGNTWYRVLTGPYQTVYVADSDQRQLHNKNHLESLLLKIPSS